MTRPLLEQFTPGHVQRGVFLVIFQSDKTFVGSLITIFLNDKSDSASFNGDERDEIVMIHRMEMMIWRWNMVVFMFEYLDHPIALVFFFCVWCLFCGW